jgi:hypothetical protein
MAYVEMDAIQLDDSDEYEIKAGGSFVAKATIKPVNGQYEVSVDGKKKGTTYWYTAAKLAAISEALRMYVIDKEEYVPCNE